MTSVLTAPTNMPGMLVTMGLGKPQTRMLCAATLVGATAYALKCPSCFFRENGEMRPLAGASSDPDATPYHFLVVPLGAAVLAGVFL